METQKEQFKLRWDVAGRLIAFLLASTSIWCLLADFYGLCPMRPFAIFILLPASVALFALAVYARTLGDLSWWRGVYIGAAAGLLAAVAYDLFRLPFVFAVPLHIKSVVPPMNLFKVFPRFGAMLLGQPIEQPAYSLSAQLLGWVYHFSNGLTLGIMYTAMIGEGMKRSWGWAVLFAAGLELAMLFTPYPRVFHIPLTRNFVIATLCAHIIFGIFLGLLVRSFYRRLPRHAAQNQSAPIEHR